MFRKSVLALAMIVAAASAWADEAVAPMSVTTEWEMSLDETGRITLLSLKPGLAKDALREILERAIRSWEFRPGTVDGVPAATDTHLRVALSIFPVDQSDGHSIRIKHVRLGGTVKDYGKLPRYSESLARAALHRKTPRQVVSVIVTYDELGIVRDAAMADDSKVAKGPLATESLRAARTWTFDPERIGGKGVGSHERILFCFDATGSSSGASCRADGAADDRSNADAPLDEFGPQSRVTLVSAVEGTVL